MNKKKISSTGNTTTTSSSTLNTVSNVVTPEQQHLADIATIIQDFYKKYNMIGLYTTLTATVDPTVSNSAVHLEVEDDTFDTYTVAEFKEIRAELYFNIQQYLVNNSIDSALYLETDPSVQELYLHFKKSLTVKI